MNSTWLRINDIGHHFIIPVKKDDLNNAVSLEFQVKKSNEECIVWEVNDLEHDELHRAAETPSNLGDDYSR